VASTAAPAATEESWTFDLPERPRSFERREPLRLDTPPSEPEPPVEAAAAELGSPESWDILAGLPDSKGAERERSPSPEPSAQTRERQALRAAPEFFSAAVEAERDSRNEPGALVPWLARAHAAAAWFATAGLTLWGAAAVVWPDRVELKSESPPAVIAGRAIEVERVRYVENAAAGLLFVVEGELRGVAAASDAPTRLELVFIAANGRELDGPAAPLGSPLDEESLRAEALGALIARQSDAARLLATHPLRPGETTRFTAVLPAAPRDARAWRIRGSVP
jgi:hypothetical protein